jgi:hypothetical protein
MTKEWSFADGLSPWWMTKELGLGVSADELFPLVDDKRMHN